MSVPTLYTQLNNGTRTAGSDCATMTVMMAVSYGSGHRYVPTVSEIRAAAGNTSTGLSTSQIRAALKALTVTAWVRGIRIEYVVPGLVKLDTVRQWLEAGHFVGTAIDYRVINRLAPTISGQSSLSAMHAVGLYGFKTSPLRSTMYDPLYDGRRRSIPSTPQAIAWSVVRAATGPFVREDGWAFAYAIKRSERPTLRRGSTGPDVTYAQQRLRAHGRTGVLVNGTFGWRTERGTRNFQKGKGLPVTGVIDAATWRELEEAP